MIDINILEIVIDTDWNESLISISGNKSFEVREWTTSNVWHLPEQEHYFAEN